MEKVSNFDFEVKIEKDAQGCFCGYRVFKLHGDRMGILINQPGESLQEGFRSLAAWAWNSALEGVACND
jgi:hypothetical protein